MRKLLLLALLASAFPLGAEAKAVHATADAWVNQADGLQLRNYGSDPELWVRGGAARAVTLIRFPAALPAGPRVRLRLLVRELRHAGTVEVHEYFEPWDESTVNYNNLKPISSQVWGSRTFSAADVGKTVAIDVPPLAGWSGGDITLALLGTAEVSFSSREGGTAPTLRVSGLTSDNEATVAPSDGDYTDPITAADNAYAGDTWCVTPTPSQPCHLEIASGLYVLQRTLNVPRLVMVSGEGKGETVLLAANGVGAAVHMDGLGVSDLSIRNAQLSGEGEVQALRVDDANEGSSAPLPIRLERVALHAEGGESNTALYTSNTGMEITVTDSDLEASGGQTALAFTLYGSYRGGTTFTNSRLSAVDSARTSKGLDLHTDFNVYPRLENTQVLAQGAGDATGIDSALDNTPVEIDGGSIVANAGRTATGILTREVSAPIIVLGADIHASGTTSGYGISTSVVTNVEDATVEGSTSAFAASSLFEGTPMSILRSRLRGGVVGMRINTLPKMTIDHAIVEGPSGSLVFWLNGEPQTPHQVTINTSVLAGPVNPSAGEGTADPVCTNVYNEHNVLLNADCSAP